MIHESSALPQARGGLLGPGPARACEFLRTIQANAQELRRNNKSVIILWMGGGPATIDIWDLKPGRPTGGEFRAIDTTAPGVQISEHMPKVAEQMRQPGHHPLADHHRRRPHAAARQLMHTSYTPNPAIAFPVARRGRRPRRFRSWPAISDISLPNYIAVGGSRRTAPASSA